MAILSICRMVAKKCSVPANGQCQEVDVAAAFGVFEGRLAPSGRE